MATFSEAASSGWRTGLEGDDVAAIKAKVGELTQASMKLGEAGYKAQATPAEGAAGSDTAKDDDVIDAEFKEVSGDDKKKSA